MGRAKHRLVGSQVAVSGTWQRRILLCDGAECEGALLMSKQNVELTQTHTDVASLCSVFPLHSDVSVVIIFLRPLLLPFVSCNSVITRSQLPD